MEPTRTRPSTCVSIPDAVPAAKGLKLVGNKNKWFHEAVAAGNADEWGVVEQALPAPKTPDSTQAGRGIH
jgi:hypothetical protein